MKTDCAILLTLNIQYQVRLGTLLHLLFDLVLGRQ